MDPFIEAERWQSFHTEYLLQLSALLNRSLPENYFSIVETSASEQDVTIGKRYGSFRPDVSILDEPDKVDTPPLLSDSDVLSASPVTRTAKYGVPPVAHRYLHIYSSTDDRQLICAVELLSPSNKMGGGLKTHRDKIATYLRDEVSYLEIDLLLQGTRTLPELNPPRSPYVITSIDGYSRHVDMWGVELDDSLPSVRAYLDQQQSVVIDLQQGFDEVFSTYQVWRLLSYDVDVIRRLNTSREQWDQIERILTS